MLGVFYVELYHENLIKKASSYGDLIIGLITDKALESYKKLPLLEYVSRKKILDNIKGVKKIVPQNEWSYYSNILKYKPDIMVHGDDWNLSENGRELKNESIKALKKINSKLIEIPHTKNISSSILQETMFKNGLINSNRQTYFRRILQSKKLCRVLFRGALCYSLIPILSSPRVTLIGLPKVRVCSVQS